MSPLVIMPQGIEQDVTPGDEQVAREAFKIVRGPPEQRGERETHLKRQFGLCVGCVHFERRVESEHGDTETVAYCSAWRVHRPPGRKVHECSQFLTRGLMPLAVMLEMALPIGIEEKSGLEKIDPLRELPRGPYL